MKYNKTIFMAILFLLSIFTLEAKSYVAYNGTGATGNNATFLVRLNSNADLLSIGFSSTNPGADHSNLSPISSIPLNRSATTFDEDGKMTVIAEAEFYAYWQIQQAGSYTISLYRKSGSLSSENGTLPYTALRLDKEKDNRIPVSNDGSNSTPLSDYSGGNILEKGSVQIGVTTSEARGFPYGTIFTDQIYIKVSSTWRNYTY